jgi:hypothetical protein
MSRRIDVAATMDTIELSDETWEWLNLIGDAVVLTQQHALAQDGNEEWFRSWDDHKAILISMIHKDTSTLGSIFMCLRCEWNHQAAALIRMLCESVITMRYIAHDRMAHPSLFWGHAVIEEYKATENILKWERGHSKPEHVAGMEAFKASITPGYEAARPLYTSSETAHPCTSCGFQRRAKNRPHRNWCNRKIEQMASETGSDRLYGLAYRYTSNYIHTSPWSLRAMRALSRRGYDGDRVLIDMSMLVRIALDVWFAWAALCDEELGWTLGDAFSELKDRVDELQEKLDAKQAAKGTSVT